MVVGPILNRTQQLQLICPIRQEEILQALQIIEDLKPPVCDVYNAQFSKKAWLVIVEEVTEAVRYFF